MTGVVNTPFGEFRYSMHDANKVTLFSDNPIKVNGIEIDVTYSLKFVDNAWQSDTSNMYIKRYRDNTPVTMNIYSKLHATLPAAFAAIVTPEMQHQAHIDKLRKDIGSLNSKNSQLQEEIDANNVKIAALNDKILELER